MNFKEQLLALEREMVYARCAGNIERLRNLEAQHAEITNAAWDEAYELACVTTPRTRSYPYPVQSPSKHWFITALRRFWRWC